MARCLSPGCGSNKQRAISSRCRKIRTPHRSIAMNSIQTCSLNQATKTNSRSRKCIPPFERSSHGLLTSNRSTGAICPKGTVRSGGAGRDRTDDLKLAKLPLSQLSYGPIRTMVGPGRLELPTSRLSGVRSNHLSYGPSGSRQKTCSTKPEPSRVRLAPVAQEVRPGGRRTLGHQRPHADA